MSQPLNHLSRPWQGAELSGSGKRQPELRDLTGLRKRARLLVAAAQSTPYVGGGVPIACNLLTERLGQFGMCARQLTCSFQPDGGFRRVPRISLFDREPIAGITECGGLRFADCGAASAALAAGTL
jgi:hypothetical protein